MHFINYIISYILPVGNIYKIITIIEDQKVQITIKLAAVCMTRTRAKCITTYELRFQELSRPLTPLRKFKGI